MVVLSITDNIIINETELENPSDTGYKYVDDADYDCVGWECVIRARTNSSNRTIKLPVVLDNETLTILIFHQRDTNRRLIITLPDNYRFHTGATSAYINAGQGVTSAYINAGRGGARFTYIGNNEYYVEHKA